MKSFLTLCCLLTLLIAKSNGQQGNMVLIDGFTAINTDEGVHYAQSGLRLLTVMPTKLEKLSFTTEAFMVDQGFAQILVGTEYQAHPSIAIATMIGLTNSPVNPIRLGITTQLRNEHWDGLALYQWGPESGYFYIGKLAYKFDKMAIGARSQRFMGTGLYLDYHISKSVTLWGQSGYDQEFDVYSSAIGIKVVF